MTTQKDENWLTPFMGALDVTGPLRDYTCIHTTKNSSEIVKKGMGYYRNKYRKPIRVSEFVCGDDEDWSMCDQDTANASIPHVVDFFAGNSILVAYGYSKEAGLGTVWPLGYEDGRVDGECEVLFECSSGPAMCRDMMVGGSGHGYGCAFWAVGRDTPCVYERFMLYLLTCTYTLRP